LQERWKWREEKEADISSYWMALLKRENTGT